MNSNLSDPAFWSRLQLDSGKDSDQKIPSTPIFLPVQSVDAAPASATFVALPICAPDDPHMSQFMAVTLFSWYRALNRPSNIRQLAPDDHQRAAGVRSAEPAS